MEYPLNKTEEQWKEELGEENYNLLKKLKVMQNRKGVQMLMPFDLSL